MLNRGAVILRCKPPAVEWVNRVDPDPETARVTLEGMNRERTVYLISDEDAESEEQVRAWVRLNFEALFEMELEGWYTEPELWPEHRTWKLFNEWFDIECHSMLVDTVEGPLVNQDF